MTSWGLIEEPSSGTRRVFCQSWPNPCNGPATRLPVTLSTVAPRTPSAESRSTGFAQWAPSRDVGAWGAASSDASAWVFSVIVMSHLHGRDGRPFVRVDLDRFVQARKGQDLAVVVGQPACQQADAAALRANEQRDQQADATTVHVLEAGEVEDDRAGTVIDGSCVAGHQVGLARRRHVAGDAECGDDPAAVQSHGGGIHAASPSTISRKSESGVMRKIS